MASGECWAGQLQQQGGRLVADARKGVLRVVRTDSNSVEVSWRERLVGDTQPPELRLCVAPGSVDFSKVKNATAVLEVRIHESNRPHFFWMQDPSMRDISTFDAFIEQLRIAVQPLRTGQQHASSMGQQGPSSNRAFLPTPTTAADRPLGAEALATALRNIQTPPAAGDASADPQALAAMLAQAYEQHGSPDPGPSLSNIVKPEALASLLHRLPADDLAALMQQLPAEHQCAADAREQLRLTLLSPAVSQQLGAVSSLLRSGQLTLEQLGLPGQGSSALDLLQAIQSQAESHASGQKPDNA